MAEKIRLKPSLIEIPSIRDPRGNLSFIEEEKHFPFKMQSVQWIYQIPDDSKHERYASAEQNKMFIPLSGSLNISAYDGIIKKTFILNRSYLGLFVPAKTWIELCNFASNTTLLVISSGDTYDNSIITDYQAFLKSIK